MYKTTRIMGTGSALPKTVVTNDDLSKIMDTSDEWIVSRTGIKERHLVKEETTASLAVEAAKRAIANAHINKEEIDLVIVGTITGDYVTPSTACEVQAELELERAVCFDINAACSGFLFALHTAHAYFMAGLYKTALIIGVESLSRIMNWQDRSTCVLFGDGAGAAIVRADAKGLMGFVQGSNGMKGKVLACQNRVNNNPLIQQKVAMDYVQMDGQEVYKFAVTTVPDSIQKVLEESEISIDEIAYFVLHQANLRILKSVAKRLHVEESRFPISLDHCGNVSAASVPILLDEMNQKGMLKRGDKIILSGFGAGLTWGTTLIEW